MKFAGRDLRTIAASLFQRRHYRAAWNMFIIYERPVQMFRKYLTGTGTYPSYLRLNTPTEALDLKLFSSHDLLTVNEIFCRRDYPASDHDEIVVDFGSNIGISAAYFLSRGPRTFVYLFEPLPVNVERLKENLQRFTGRYQLEEVAVGLHDGQVIFGWEETGRYGGVDAAFEQKILVKCRNANSLLSDILARHEFIDILKIDIETLEEAVLTAIPRSIARRIKKIYVEFAFEENPLFATHTYKQYGSVAQFTLR